MEQALKRELSPTPDSQSQGRGDICRDSLSSQLKISSLDRGQVWICRKRLGCRASQPRLSMLGRESERIHEAMEQVCPPSDFLELDDDFEPPPSPPPAPKIELDEEESRCRSFGAIQLTEKGW